MSHVYLFPFNEYWWLYGVFVALVLGLLLLDLGIFHRKAHVVTFKESAAWSVVWFGLAMAFNLGLYLYASATFADNPRLFSEVPGSDPQGAARQVSLEFLTGFIIEKALAVDNIFIFIVVFNYFAVPAIYQHRVLFYGIIGALVFRAIFIAIGASLLQIHWVIIVAGVFLMLTGVKILFAPDKKPDPGANPLIKWVRKVIPVTSDLHGQKFFVRQNKILYATPLFMSLLFIEFSDIVFAIDSVPAIFALTKEPLIVFTSNMLAILGLRSLYFMLADVVDRFHYLKYALGLILIFVGLKMTWLNEAFGGKFPVSWSLGIIASLLVGAILVSLWKPLKEAKKDEEVKSLK